jgi:hypothetical protein
MNMLDGSLRHNPLHLSRRSAIRVWFNKRERTGLLWPKPRKAWSSSPFERTCPECFGYEEPRQAHHFAAAIGIGNQTDLIQAALYAFTMMQGTCRNAGRLR